MSFRERRPDRTGDFIRRASVRAGWGPVRARRAAVRARRASVRAAAALVLAAGVVLTPLMSTPLAPTTAGTAGIAHAASPPPVSIIMDRRPLPTDVPAQILGGRTMVPLRAIFDALGAEVAWDSATRTVTAHRGDRTVRLTAGDRTAVIDGTWVSLDAPPVIVGGRTLVPLRFVAEAFGADVAWDAASRTVTISSAGEGGLAAGVPAAGDSAAAAGAIDVVGPVPAPLAASVRAELPGLWRHVADFLGVRGHLRAVPRVILLGDRASYRQRLVEDGTPLLTAERIAARAAGSTDGHRVFVVADAETVDILGTLAHELGHVAVHRLALDTAMPQWLQEGLVEYVARSVVEGERWTPLGSRYWAAVQQAVFDLAAAGQLEDLFDDNTDFIDRLGDYPAHAQAMLAVTLLWDRWGDQAVAAYLNGLKAGTPHAQAFQAAFKMPVQEFQSLFRTHLRQRARVDQSRVRVVLELPEAVAGSLTVFAPGRRRADSWKLSGAGRITVRYEAGQGVTVGGAVKRDSGWYWTLAETPEYLIVYVIPDEAVRVGDLRVTQVAVFFDALYGSWYWLGSGVTLTDGSTEDVSDNPDLEDLLRVLEVRTL